MRILLVQTPTSHLAAGERVYPLGLSRLSNVIPPRHEKWGLDMNLSPDPWPELKAALIDAQPNVVALSFRNLDPLAGLRSSYLSSLKTAAAMVRLMVPQAKIWAGGPAFSLFGERLMREIPEIDCGVIGEGESSFRTMMSPSCDLAAVPGLLWRKGDSLERNAAAPGLALDSAPEMDLNLFRPEEYVRGNKYVAAIGIEGKRGCDLRCGYCVYPRLGGRKLRLRSPDNIVDEMERLHKGHGVELFHFTDSVLNRPRDHFEAVCGEILRRKLRVRWTGFFREDSLTEHACHLAEEAGLAACYFSADALTDHGLKVLSKRMTKEHILQAARITAKSGILTVCHFLVNLPGETEAHIVEARRLLDEILQIHEPAGNLGAVIFNNLRLYPGAPLTQELLKMGLLDERADLLYPVYYDPPEFSHALHEMEAHCHAAGVFSRLAMKSASQEDIS
jgi:putative variant cofactor biosynthesis B12-binding/radical SAM domain protein 1